MSKGHEGYGQVFKERKCIFNILSLVQKRYSFYVGILVFFNLDDLTTCWPLIRLS